jgi:hypothetical protein
MASQIAPCQDENEHAAKGERDDGKGVIHWRPASDRGTWPQRLEGHRHGCKPQYQERASADIHGRVKFCEAHGGAGVSKRFTGHSLWGDWRSG